MNEAEAIKKELRRIWQQGYRTKQCNLKLSAMVKIQEDDLNQSLKAIQSLKQKPRLSVEKIERIKGNLMYAFPQASYTNSQIIAYQNGLEKLAKAIAEGDVWK